MKKVVSKRNDIAFYIKIYPLPNHKGAYEKAKAIICEKSIKLLEDSFEKKKLPEPKCKTSVVDENIRLAKKIGIIGVPSLILHDGTIISGYRDAESIIRLVDRN